jgi:hypothetical protein
VLIQVAFTNKGNINSYYWNFNEINYLHKATASPAGPVSAKISNGPFGTEPALESRSARSLVRMQEMITNVFTEQLPGPAFRMHRENLGVMHA